MIVMRGDRPGQASHAEWTGRAGPARPADRCPAQLAAAPAFAALLVVCTLGELAGRGLPLPVEVAALAAVVAFVGWTARAGAGWVAVAGAELCLNGFRENSLGTLHAHPAVDGPAVAAFLGVWAVAFVSRAFAARAIASRIATSRGRLDRNADDELDLYLIGPDARPAPGRPAPGQLGSGQLGPGRPIGTPPSRAPSPRRNSRPSIN